MKKSILIVGAGTGGISVSARLRKELGDEANITIVDSQDKHYYQPLWTLVGAGLCSHSSTIKNQSEVIPPGVEWVNKKVTEFLPDENAVVLENGVKRAYDYLVVAAGIQMDWNKIKGIDEALKTPYVTSNYLTEGSKKTWELFQSIKEGNAVFTQPPMPIKCAGAPQKAAYLADDYFRKQGKRQNINVIFASQAAKIFGVEKYRNSLEKIVKRKEIDTRFEHNLIEIKAQEKIAVFGLPDGKTEEITYNMLHVVPSMSAPDFIKNGPLADVQGWVDVDKFTLQHNRYPNIFSLGDCSSLPTSRTGAAIRKQAPVLVSNLVSLMRGKPLTERYDGYSSCPLVTGYGKVVLAEFDYNGKPAETFPFDQAKERWSMWVLKAYVLPKLYWLGMLKGKA